MKKSLFILFVCLASCAFAQKSFFGVNAGVNVATQQTFGYSTVNTTAKTFRLFFSPAARATFGVFYERSFTDQLSLRINAQYMALGYAKSFDANDLHINYLTFPLTAHYHPTKHLSLNAGPYLSFTLGGDNFAGQSITQTYHKNDFGFSFGGEHDLYKNLAMGVNYFIGLKNIWLDDQGGTISYTNRALQFTLIYKFKKPI